MASLVAVEDTGHAGDKVWTHNDPAIFRNERVLRTLLKRELKICPTGPSSSKNYFLTTQTELKPGMRREVANWMLELCEEEGCSPQVFCLAINYLDRFLSACKIARTQLQLVGAVCLLVSWKVRGHSPITAQRLIEYTDYTITLPDLLEWEFLLLSKLDWDLSAVIAPDFVEHILQRLLKLDLAWNIDITRKNTETLIYLCYSHFSLASYPPSLIAVSSIMTTLRPTIESSLVPILRDTPSPSSSSSSSSCHSSPLIKSDSDSPLERVISALQKMTMSESGSVLTVMEKLEEIMRASLPPSPAQSEEEHPPASSSSSSCIIAPRALFLEEADPGQCSQ